MLLQLSLLALSAIPALAAPVVVSPETACPLVDGCIIDPWPCGCCYNGTALRIPCLELEADIILPGCPYYVLEDGTEVGDIVCIAPESSVTIGAS